MNHLDDGILIKEDKQNIIVSTNDIINPYIPENHKKMLKEGSIIDVNKLTIRELAREFGSLFVITSKDIDVDIFKPKLCRGDYLKIRDSLVVKQVNFSILKSKHACKSLMIINKKHITSTYNQDNHYIDFNNTKQFFNEYVLIICWFEFFENSITNYIKQFNSDVSIHDIYNIMCIDIYTRPNKYNENNNLIRRQMINSMHESNYWCLFNNCKLNITVKFIDRQFNFKACVNLEDKNIENIITKLSNTPVEDHNYLGHIYRKQIYIDASSCVNKTGYKLYNVAKELDLKYDDINLMLETAKQHSNREFYTLVSNLLISKNCCHLIINNEKFLNDFDLPYDDNKLSLLQKYCQYWAYLWSYAWLTFYTEECIKKTHIVESDRFVFTIDVASKLPYFPGTASNPRLNPYIPILVSDDILNPNNNNLGVEVLLSKNRHDLNRVPGIVTLDKFRERFNIFTSGNSNINNFDNMNWNNMAICGSIMAACVPRFNPIMLNCLQNHYDNEIFKSFVDNYYKNADVDIMINVKGIQFVNKVYDIINTIKNNIINHNRLNTSFEEEEFIFTSISKTVGILIDNKFIMKLLETKKLWKLNKKFTLEYIVENINTSEIKEEIYKHYVDRKLEDNKKYIDTSEWSDPKYIYYFDIVPIEKVNIFYSCSKKEEIKTEQDNDDIEINDNTLTNNYEILSSDYLFKYDENLKYKVISKFLPHSLEIFQIKYEQFFSTVAKFHKPIVRSYYNGNNVYLLPSCITACMAFINVDYKYFSGSKDPIAIINKYRSRGFGTYLNDKEKIHMLDYINSIPELKSIYNLNIKHNNSVNSTLTELIYNHKIFRDTTSQPNYNHMHEFIRVSKNNYTHNNICSLYEQFFKIKTKPIIKDLFSRLGLNCINSYGYVSTFNKWLIDLVYENPNTDYHPS